MGNRVSCLKGKNEPASEITLAIIGPDDAGKTTLSSVLAGEPLDPHVAPTVGFRNVKFTLKKFDVTLYDLGGGKGIRPIWKNYYSEIYGLVYMVDSSSQARIKEARDLLRDTLEHPQVAGKPLLVLANKVDVDGHMEEVDIVNQLELDHTVNVNNSPSHFLMVSALQSSKAKMKKVVVGGFLWLLDSVRNSMDRLETRVRLDTARVKEAQDREREERRERVRRQREAREKLEEEERRRLGIRDEDEEISSKDMGDPFKALDYQQLKMQEQRQKAEKKKKQELLLMSSQTSGSRDRKDFQRVKDQSSLGYSLDDTMTLPRFGQQQPRFGRSANLDGLDIGHPSALMSGRSTRPTALPPLEPITAQSLDAKVMDKKKGKKKMVSSSYDGDGHHGDGMNGRSEYDSYGSYGGLLSKHDVGREGGLRLSHLNQGSRSYGDDERDLTRNGRLDESDVHDLTPRVAKPKNYRKVKAGSRIDEDDLEESGSQYRNLRMSLKEYGDPRMSQKLDEYRDKYPLHSSADTKEYRSSEGKQPLRYSNDAYSTDRKRWEKGHDRDDSTYRKSLKDISPPDLDRFDDDDDREEDKDEGIEEDSDNGSDDARRFSGRYGSSSYGKFDRKPLPSSKKDTRNGGGNRRQTQYSEEEEEDEEEYGSRNNKLKDTLKFSRYDDDDTESRNYQKEIRNLKYRRDNDLKSSHYKEDRYDSAGRRVTSPPDQSDQRRKKKKNILKSNKLMPSDEDEDRDIPLSQRYSSPRLVQEHGSRNTSDADTPSHGRNARTTSYFNKGSNNQAQKWNLAEDLPTIDNDSRLRRNFRPNYEDSDGEDVVF